MLPNPLNAVGSLLRTIRTLAAHARFVRDRFDVSFSDQWSDLVGLRKVGLGAVDYVTKPFGVAELLARIRVRLSGHTAADPETVALGSGTARLSATGIAASGRIVLRVNFTPGAVDETIEVNGRRIEISQSLRRENIG